MQKLGPNQTKWIAALRSGRYKQGQDGLTVRHNDGEFDCCLGVGCKELDVPGKHRDIDEWTEYGASRETGNAPEELVGLLALHNADGTLAGVTDLGGYWSLVEANDHSVPFAQIADFCEAYPEAVFHEPR